MTKNKRERRRAVFATCTACLITGGIPLFTGGPIGLVAPAYAEVSPYAALRVTRDDNLFRLSDDADTEALLGTDQRSDTYSVIEAGVDVDAQVSRQRFNLHGDLNQTRFSRFSTLDSEGGSARARWDWMVASIWQGRAGYEYSRSLGNFEVLSTGRNLRTDRRAYVEGDMRVASDWRLRAGISDRDVRNSQESQRVFDTRALSGEFGLHYVREPAADAGADAEQDYVGLHRRDTLGEYPNPQTIDGVVVDNDYGESETGLVAGWRFDNRSRMQALLGYSERNYDRFTERDFSGPTGRLTYNWQVGGKTSLNISTWRELTVADDLSAGYVVSEGARLGPDWAMTRKLTLQGRIGRETREYRGDAQRIVTPTEERVDTLDSFRVFLWYAPMPAMQLGLGWAAEERESNRALEDYRYHSVGATLRADF